MAKNEKYEIGILGGGQLARMMLLKAHELGIPACALSTDPKDPAAQVTNSWIQGDPKKTAGLKKFLNQVKVVTYESEFIDADKVVSLLKDAGARSYPKTQQMKLLQQRKTQKAWLDSVKLPTSPWLDSEQIRSFSDLQSTLGSKKIVMKKNMGGYDGYGTFIVEAEQSFQSIDAQLAEQKISYVAEAFVPFKRELAVTFARSRTGQIVKYPIVESFQTDSRCDWVKGPMRTDRHLRFLNKIQRALTSLEYVGVIAFELFETRLGELLVNEIAPRVHNSSHYSLNGFNEDQFSMHIKAVTGRDLVAPQCFAGGFAMKNLIGSGIKTVSLKTKKAVHVHWYGKHENRKGRKMGHVNALASNAKAALKLAENSVKDMKV